LDAKQVIEEILEKTFQEKQKQKVYAFSERFNFACPYCGDSKNIFKKRGNLYKDSYVYHCFNCGEHKGFREFLADFGYSLSDAGMTYEEYSKATKQHTEKKTLKVQSDIGFSKDDIMKAYRCVPAERNPMMKEYLEGRRITDFSPFMYGNGRLFMLNLNGEKVVGMQIRTFDKNAGPKYLSQPYSKIYEQIHGKPFEDERKDDIDNVSLLFGRFYTDFSKPFYILEGFIDSVFIQNSVAVSGAGRDLDLFESYPEARYLYDNDATGRKYAVRALDNGRKVFMWKKFLDDWNIKNKKIKDINDLITQDVITEQKLNEVIEKYFTDDSMFIIYI